MTPQETYLLIFQVMQLPIVALIVLFSFRTKIPWKNKEFQSNLRNLRGFVNNYPFRFIAFGLMTNFIYLLLKITSNNQIIPWSIFDLDFQESLITLFEALTAYFFLIEAISYFSPSKKNKIDPLRLLYIGITILFAFIILSNWKERNVSLDISNFIVYGLVTFYLYKQFSKNKIDVEDLYPNRLVIYFLISGFGLWTMLQPLSFLGDYFNINENIIQRTGFGLSLIGKSFVLFGLYDFFIRVQKSTTSRNDLLNRKIRKVNSLPKLINEISNSESIEELAEKVTKHLTQNEVFNFDFVVFSEANYSEQKIFYKASKSVPKKIQHIEEWVLKEGIPFGHHDIMAKVFQDKKTVHVYRDFVDGHKVNLNASDCPLNKNVFEKYNHFFLDRLLIPVFTLNNSPRISEGLEQQGNRVFAIIEAGFYAPKEEVLSQRNLQIEGELKVYIDNCSQTYLRLYDNFTNTLAQRILKKADENSQDQHLEFLRLITQYTCENLNMDFGLSIICPFNRRVPHENFIFPDMDIAQRERKKIYSVVDKHIKASNQLSFSELKSRQKLIEAELSKYYKGASCELFSVVERQHFFVCILFLKRNITFFNTVIKSRLHTILNSVAITYQEKKFHYSVAKLTTPRNTLIDMGSNMLPMIQILEDYYETPFISIWMFDDKGENLIQRYASETFMNTCGSYGKTNINPDTLNDDKCKIIPLGIENTNPEHLPFRKYGQKNNIKSLLTKPLKKAHQNYGFINIYFKNELQHSFYDDVGFLNLVAEKILSTIQTNGIVSSFRHISASFRRDELKATLQTITNNAMELLDSDPVILFKSNDGDSVYFEGVTYSYREEFKDKRIIEIFEKGDKRRVDLAEWIIKDGTRYFNNHSEYINYISRKSRNKERIFKEEFWTREGIQAMAAIKLVNDERLSGKSVGVMFINFRKQVVFDEELKTILEPFASFASAGIANALVSERNRQFVLRNLRMTKPLIEEALNAGALHDAKKRFTSIYGFYIGLVRKLENPFDFDSKRMDLVEVRRELNKLTPQLKKLHKTFDKIEAMYKPDKIVQYEEKVNLVALIKKQVDLVVEEFHQEKKIHIEDNYSKNIICIDCDELQIGMVLENLLKNSYEAIENRGIIEIKLRESGNEKIKLEIIDNGKGIDKSLKEMIFIPNITSKANGTGFGLPTCKYIVETNHRGNINGVTKNKFTTFTIVLPKTQKIILEDK